MVDDWPSKAGAIPPSDSTANQIQVRRLVWPALVTRRSRHWLTLCLAYRAKSHKQGDDTDACGNDQVGSFVEVNHSRDLQSRIHTSETTQTWG